MQLFLWLSRCLSGRSQRLHRMTAWFVTAWMTLLVQCGHGQPMPSCAPTLPSWTRRKLFSAMRLKQLLLLPAVCSSCSTLPCPCLHALQRSCSSAVSSFCALLLPSQRALLCSRPRRLVSRLPLAALQLAHTLKRKRPPQLCLALLLPVAAPPAAMHHTHHACKAISSVLRWQWCAISSLPHQGPPANPSLMTASTQTMHCAVLCITG